MSLVFGSAEEAMQHLANVTGCRVVVGKDKTKSWRDDPGAVFSRLPAKQRELFKKKTEGRKLTPYEEKELGDSAYDDETEPV